MLARDPRRRKKLWFAPLPGPVVGPPLVTDGAVVVGVAAPAGDEVVGLAREDGAVAWRAAGVRGAPQVVDGVVCVERAHEDAARVVGLRAASGETVWERLASGAVPRSLASGGLALFARGATVDALHGTLGTRAWRLELAADVSAPLAAGAGHLAIVTADRRIAVYPLAD